MATLTIPTEGLFRNSGDIGSTIYKKNADGSVVAYPINTPEMWQSLGLDPKNYPNYGAQNAALWQALGQKYGLNFNSLPEFNVADYISNLNGPGGYALRASHPEYFQGTSGYKTQSGSFADFLQQPQTNAGSTQVTINTDPALQGYVNPNAAFQYQGSSVFNPAPAQSAGQVDPKTGLPLANPNSAFQYQGSSAFSGVPSGTNGTQQQMMPDQATQQDQTLDQFLASSSLPQDQKDLIKTAYSAIATNDQAKANQMLAAFNAATQYSSPYFKAQIGIAMDALQRGLSQQEGDLSFKEQQLHNSLTSLEQNTSAAKDYLSFQQRNELNQLGQQYKQDLQQTQDDLAARGLTTSSIRSRKEDILRANYEGMTESTNRNFGYQTGQLDSKLASERTNTAQQLAYYQQLFSQNKLDLLRQTEQQVGSSNLSAAGYQTFGGVGGTIPRQQTQDALSFANSYVSF